MDETTREMCLLYVFSKTLEVQGFTFANLESILQNCMYSLYFL